ncbi:FtsX-like permease family protein, partial [Streptomyces sp. NPDC001770]
CGGSARALSEFASVGGVGPPGFGGLAPVPSSDGVRWRATSTVTGPDADSPAGTVGTVTGTGAAPAFRYGTGSGLADRGSWGAEQVDTLLLRADRPAPPALKAVATDAYLASSGARLGQQVDLALGGETVRVTLVKSVRELPTTGPGGTTGSADGAAAGVTGKPGGALLLDLRAVSEALDQGSGATPAPTEWWLSTAPGDGPAVAAELRALPGTDPSQVRVRDEVARELADDPLGAGPQSALRAAAAAAAALAAVGFAVGLVGSRSERSAEFAVLRALGASRRRLARTLAVEQGVLIALALVIGLALGTVLTRAVVPLVVLTGQAARPVPDVLVLLPAGQVAALLASVIALPLLFVAATALRRSDAAVSLRHQGDN